MVQAPTKPELDSSPSGSLPPGDPIVLRLPQGVLSDELLIEISNLNEPLHFERSPEGALEISPPPGTLSGRRGSRIAVQIINWADEHENGEAFGAASGFRLPTTAARDPDACWVSKESLRGVDTENEALWSVCPDLIVEVRSRGQTIRRQQEKMEEWMEAGARLGWLIDVYTEAGEVWVYREGNAEPERLERPDSLNGENVAEGLTVDLTRVWR